MKMRFNTLFSKIQSSSKWLVVFIIVSLASYIGLTQLSLSQSNSLHDTLLLAKHAQLEFSHETVYHTKGVAYDLYSIHEIAQGNIGKQWLTFPLPQELNRNDYPPPWQPPTNFTLKNSNIPMKSPATQTGLAYVEQIYVISDISFVDRHEQLKKTFRKHSIPIESIDWRWKWNRTTCSLKENEAERNKKLNTKNAIKYIRRNQCPIIMKHVDVWHEMVERNIRLALILEDDPLFVPFFREKLNRMIYTAIRTGALRINTTCIHIENQPIETNEWRNQEPMFVVGTCFNFHDASFRLTSPIAQPILSTHKKSSSRCAHAYLLTACSARAMLDQIAAKPTTTDTPDFLMNDIFRDSPILQAFWMDPPLVYQGNRVRDLDNIPTFKETKYNLPLK